MGNAVSPEMETQIIELIKSENTAVLYGSCSPNEIIALPLLLSIEDDKARGNERTKRRKGRVKTKCQTMEEEKKRDVMSWRSLLSL